LIPFGILLIKVFPNKVLKYNTKGYIVIGTVSVKSPLKPDSAHSRIFYTV